MGTLKRLGGRGGSVAKKRHSRRWLRLMLLGRANAGRFRDERRSNLLCEALQELFTYRSHAGFDSPRLRAPYGFHHFTRFKLGLQNKAFLHFPARGKMTIRICVCA